MLNVFPENTLSSGPFSPSNIEQGTTVKQDEPAKRKIEYSIQDSILALKSEPLWEMEPLHPSERRPDSDFTIDMEARTILELCKYV